MRYDLNILREQTLTVDESSQENEGAKRVELELLAKSNYGYEEVSKV